MDNRNIYVKFKKTHPDAVLPVANNHATGVGDTGYDLTAVEDANLQGNSSVIVPVGLTLADITPGYWIRIEPRSGLGFKYCIQPHLGVIDNGYRGDMGVKLYNFSKKRFIVKAGERIAQLVVYPLLQPEMSFTEEITETSRGDKGFGSSDKKPHVTTQETDDWFYANTYQVDEGRVEHAKFETAEEFMEYAKETDMPDDLYREFLAAGVWKTRK